MSIYNTSANANEKKGITILKKMFIFNMVTLFFYKNYTVNYIIIIIIN